MMFKVQVLTVMSTSYTEIACPKAKKLILSYSSKSAYFNEQVRSYVTSLRIITHKGGHYRSPHREEPSHGHSTTILILLDHNFSR
jgi:hypothetical protein